MVSRLVGAYARSPMPVDTNNTKLVVAPGTHASFDHLVTASAGLLAYVKGHAVQTGPHGYAVAPPGGGPVCQVCFTENAEVHFDANRVLSAITDGGWPSEIEFTFAAMNTQRVQQLLTGVMRLMGNTYAHAFVTYFETIRPRIEAVHGTQKNWPETLDFGRVVRNAFAHGGTVEMRPGSREGSVWRGLSYTQADNGRQLLYNDMTQGDLTLLMLDMDELL